jgi:hypothetical protein
MEKDMAKFKRKAVEVDAVQWFNMGDHPSVIINERLLFGTGIPHKTPVIETPDGWQEVTPGDWIITSAKGEHYLCKPDLFDMTYESVNSNFGALTSFVKDCATPMLMFTGRIKSQRGTESTE